MSGQGQKLRSGINQGIFLLGLVKEGNPSHFSAPSYLPSMLRIHISSSSKKWLGQPRVSMSLNPSQGTCQSKTRSYEEHNRSSHNFRKWDKNLSYSFKFMKELKNVLLPIYVVCTHGFNIPLRTPGTSYSNSSQILQHLGLWCWAQDQQNHIYTGWAQAESDFKVESTSACGWLNLSIHPPVQEIHPGWRNEEAGAFIFCNNHFCI